MKDLLSNVLTVVLVVCAVTITGIVVRREFFPRGPEAQQPREVRDWESIGRTGRTLGQAEGAVVIVEFADFQCPFCARAAANLDEIRARYPDDVTVVYRHFPLTTIHPHALAAANAAECAAEQGRFQEMHDRLYAGQDSIGTRAWSAFAEDAGVEDLAGFELCVEERRYADRIADDVRAAERIGLTGTPSILVNQLLLPGTPSVYALEQHVLAALEPGELALEGGRDR